LTKTQAAERLGVSTKTIENLGVSKITNRMWTRPTGGPPLRVYATDDVERLARARAEAGSPKYANQGFGPQIPPDVLASLSPQPNESKGLVVGAVHPISDQRLESFLEAISKKVSSTKVPSSEKVFLTIPEAAEFAGLSESYIRRGCRDGSLPAIRDGRTWRIRRATLLAL
jgi:excisionase family DNA binding protein